MKPVPTRISLKVQKGRYHYLQRRVPTDIMRLPEDRREAVLGTRSALVKVYLGDDKKDALRHASEEWARIEALFDQLRGQALPQPVAKLTSEALEAVAWTVYTDTKAALDGDLAAHPDFDPERLGLAYDAACDPWREGFHENHWPKAVNARVLGELAAAGYAVDEDHPAFAEARRLIATAYLEAHEVMRHRLAGDMAYQPSVVRRVVVAATGCDTATLDHLFTAWKGEKARPAKTVTEFDRAVRRFKELHGDLPAIAITKTHVREFKEALRKLPSALSGEQRAMPLPDLLKALEKKPADKTLSAGAVNKHIGAVSAILAWANKHGYFESAPTWGNPATGLKLDEAAEANPRIPFTKDDLKKLFHSPVFTEGARPKGGGGEAAKWLPLLGLFTGAREEELGQALVSDVREQGGIWYIDLNTLDEGKRLKSASSRRKVPLHPELIRCGFLGYVRSATGKQGNEPLFPDLKPDSHGHKTGNWSKWFNRYKVACGVTVPARAMKDFHSFRHGFKDACRAARIGEEVHDALTGHSGGGVGRSYGSEKVPLDVKAEAIAKVRFEADLSHLYVDQERKAG